MNRLPKYLFISLVFAMMAFVTVHAEDKGEQITKHCLPLQNIDRIEVVDNQTILFHMRGKEIWKSSLPHYCAGLKFEGGIAYSTSINQLCDLDIVKVLRVGTPCQLGAFEKYEPEAEEAAENKPE
ncbi:MAG: hypothetical protein JRH15_14550 [Deltaproteobacteria bacterium]|nr:hypothetical protein [Deltaproteobacteria bacterium]